MKIAVAYENGEIFQHFGHTEQFAVYETDGKEILSSKICPTNGSGHGALAGFLGDLKADVVICGGIGSGARGALAAAGIRLCAGCSGNAEEAVRKFLAGTLEHTDDATCDHHGHDHDDGHSCGGHSCGEHACGHTCGK